MKVSVIVTTYENPFFLRKVLDSFLDQERLPDELIVADDGSGKETEEVIREFSSISPVPVRHAWQENKGFRAAKIRNEAIKKTSGDYIILADGDCIVNRHFISDHLSLAEQDCFIQGKRVHVSRDSVGVFTHLSANSPFILLKMALTGQISNFHHLIRFPYYLSVKNQKLKGIKSCNMSFFRKDILAVNGFNEDFIGWGNEDSDLAGRFFKFGLKKKVHQFMAICFHLWHPTNKTPEDRNRELLETTLASKEYFCKNGLAKEN
ncbi:MAG: glycosyltransferase family 2 protein [Nitrospirae bacterium]|nr:glycosyltransferase family 2 protein [Nitrospirota bacterium]